MGYFRAGWEVVGVDIEEQPNYPFPFIRMDALDCARLIPFFDAVHASPPCLRDTAMKYAPGAKGDSHPEVIGPTRDMLQASGKPYVIENVMPAKLVKPVVLNGFMFGLGATTSDGTRFHLERKRKFETNWPLIPPTGWEPRKPIIGVWGGHVRNRSAEHGGRKTRDFVGENKPRLMREAMGIDFPQSMNEMSQAVPPAYTEFVGARLMEYLCG